MWKNVIAVVMPKILLWLRPFVLWVDKTFTIPFSVKLINADHYFIWKPIIQKGMVFITDTYGQGSNLLNPSKGKHGGIYFGTGLKSHLEKMKNSGEELTPYFHKFYDANIDKIYDDVEYVIEALGNGLTATSVIKFLTTKDVVDGYIPTFCDEEAMARIAEHACLDLGIPYDFEFHGRDNAKYCFEAILDAYNKEFPEVKFVTNEMLGYTVYTADAFRDESKWLQIIDSNREFPELTI